MHRSNCFSSAFLCLVFTLGTISVCAQTLTVNTSLCGCQPAAGTPCPGNTNYIMGTFAFNITSGCPSFTAINAFTTSGTYVASDILNFKLYETNFSVFNTSTLVATIAAGLGPGTHTFSGFNRTTCAAAQRYYWITCDFSPTAVSGHTIKIDLITAAMYAITGTVNYGTNTAAGLQTICNPLPVTLVSFAGENNGNSNILRWTTASETNNDHFTLERSLDGVSFTRIAIVDGSGTTSQLSDYFYRDESAGAAPVVYYRLQQTDYNGQSEFVGGIVALSPVVRDSAPFVSVGFSSIHITQQQPTLGFTIYDLYGRQCLSGTSRQGTTEIPIDELAVGTYIVRMDDVAQTSILFRKLAD